MPNSDGRAAENANDCRSRWWRAIALLVDGMSFSEATGIAYYSQKEIMNYDRDQERHSLRQE